MKLLESFSHKRSLVVFYFYWNLSDSKFPQVSSTLLSIQTNFNNAVVWILKILPRISSYYSSFPDPSWPYWVHQLQLVSPSLS